MEDMMKMYRMAGNNEDDFSFPLDTVLVINSAAPLTLRIQSLLTENAEKAEGLAAYIYRLALLSHRHLSANEMQAFLQESYRILTDLSK
jgi:hypothetical protein